MKAIKLFTTTLALVLITSSLFAQKPVVEGKLNFLKGQKVINVQYDYDRMSVGKYKDSKKYVAEKVKEKNKDEAGSGNEWKRKWIDDRESRFQPKFEELINKYLADKGVKVVPNAEDAEYTLILKTTHTEPGWNIGISRRPAHINVEAVFVETGSDKKKGKISLKKVAGQDAMGFDYDRGTRLQEAYAKSGKLIGKYLVKKVLK